jgi:hypothetical protein
MANSKRFFGLLAEYKSPADIFHACEKVRDAGYKHWDSFTPFPMHGLDKAMGIKRSILPWLVFVGGMTGAASGMTLQWFTSAVDYPVIIAAKPYFSYQAFVPITFELGVLFASFTAVFGMLGLNKLPRWHHPLFAVERFRGVTDDRYFIAIETSDPKFDLDRTRRLLEESGAISVEEVED